MISTLRSIPVEIVDFYTHRPISSGLWLGMRGVSRVKSFSRVVSVTMFMQLVLQLGWNGPFLGILACRCNGRRQKRSVTFFPLLINFLLISGFDTVINWPLVLISRLRSWSCYLQYKIGTDTTFWMAIFMNTHHTYAHAFRMWRHDFYLTFWLSHSSYVLFLF